MINFNKEEEMFPGKQVDLLGAIFILIIVSYYLFVFIQQISTILDLRFLHAQFRQLFPYYQINAPELFKGDYITSFYLGANQPILYDFLTRAWLSCGGNLLELHRVMPITLWVLLLTSVAISGWKIQGIIGSLGTFGLVLSQPLFLYQITSAIPHAFAFPLLGWCIVALLYGSVFGLVGLTILSSVLYPPVTPIIGLSLGGYLISHYMKELKKLTPSIIIRILTIVSLTGCLSIFLGSSVLQPKEGFGESLAPFQEIEEYPENGPEGHNSVAINQPLFYNLAKFVYQFNEGIGMHRVWKILLFFYLYMVLRGFITYTHKSQYRQGLGIYIIVITIIVCLAFVLKPFYAYRFFLYPFAILFSILIPIGMTKIFSHSKNKKCSFYLPILFIFMFTLTFDGYSQTKIGYRFKIDTESRKVLDFVKKLPANTLIAGWPDYTTKGNLTEIIPYIAKQHVLVLGKAHSPTHKGYLIEMRNRMYLLIDAYSATNKKPIEKLKDIFGVNYLLVDKRHFVKENHEPKYFAPFDNYIQNVWEKRKTEGFLLSDTSLLGKVFETENYYILNLNDFLAEAPHH